jgi:carboxybiotin decarboxylase
MELINTFMETAAKLWNNTGFVNGNWMQYTMVLIACILFYFAIVKKFEPLLLLPIAFGMILANIPGSGVIHMDFYDPVFIRELGYPEGTIIAYRELLSGGGLLDYLYLGVKLGIYPPLIFLGIGAMTDFGPLLANPKSLILGAAAQLGIFAAFLGALFLGGFDFREAASIGIIGGADGPTAIFLTKTLAPHLLGPIAVAAYTYMALVPLIQPPIMRLMTTKKERSVVMEQLRHVSKTEKILFPIIVTVLVAFLIPDATPLIGMLMLGNLFRESAVVDRLTKTASGEMINMVTILLGVSVGATTIGTSFLRIETLMIILLGVFAFMIGTSGGVLFGKIMYVLTNGKVNPLIGSAGVSAVPMAARVSQSEGQRANPNNFLLMHAMGPNVAGVIGSAIAAGILLSLFK